MFKGYVQKKNIYIYIHIYKTPFRNVIRFFLHLRLRF